ncbi:MAG TPA: choice-of-anchor D domain-containing protein [Acidobacteriota bacterium]|nr:choice-of-anchor D domain-containing protein [Acidobacteriota bacterium]
MLKPGRKLFSTFSWLTCGILLAGGTIATLRPVAANSAARSPLPEAAPMVQQVAPLEFFPVPETGAVTFRAQTAKGPDFYLLDGRDLPEGSSVEAFRASSSNSAQPLAMITADINGDGSPDILTSYGASDSRGYLTFRAQDGQGQFSETKVSSLPYTAPIAFRVGDFNADGLADLAVVNANTNKLSLVAGDGQGNFSALTDLSVGKASTSLVVADLNHTGLPGIAVGDASGEVRVIARKDSSFTYEATEAQILKAGAGVVALEAADVNADQRTDLVVATKAGVEIWAGDGAGKFSRQTTLASSEAVTAMALRDLNLDLHADIVAATVNGSVNVWTNQKGAGFGTAYTFKPANGATAVKIDWMDTDAYPDIVVVDSANSQVTVSLNRNGRSFGQTATYKVDSNPVDVAIGRFDIDAVSDMVVAKHGQNTQTVAFTYGPQQAQNDTIFVTDLRGLLNIPVNGTMADISSRVNNNLPITFLDAMIAANNDPGPEVIAFRVGEDTAAGVPPGLAGSNLREPPALNQSIVSPNTIIVGTTGERLYNVSLVNTVGVTGLTSLTLTAPNGNGTTIRGENLAGTTTRGNGGLPRVLGSTTETAVANINKVGPDIRIVGDNLFNTGFEVGASTCRFESLIIAGFNRFGSQGGAGASAIELNGVGSQSNTVSNCYLGALDLFGSSNFLNADGDLTISNGSFTNTPQAGGVPGVNDADVFRLGNRRGVRINGAGNTTVTSVSASGQSGRTIIAGNHDHGILVEGGSASNQITNNFIGVLRNGATPFGNGFEPNPSSGSAGIELRNNATGNTISGNTISCSGVNGNNGFVADTVNGILYTAQGNNAGPSRNTIQNNIIGLQASGINVPLFTSLVPARNTGSGILFEASSTFNVINNNTVSANVVHGIFLRDLGTNSNDITNNRVGTDSTGRLTNGGDPTTNNRGNQQNGIVISDQASLNDIDGNTISNNLIDGLAVVDTYFIAGHPFPGNQGTDGNDITNNRIGTDSSATTTALGAVLSNGRNGITLGLGPGGQDGNVQLNFFSKNLIFFNGIEPFPIGDGINIDGENCDLNTITECSIVGNGIRGIRIVTNQLDADREGPAGVSGPNSFAHEKYTVTADDDGTSELPDEPASPPAVPVSQPRAAIKVKSALLNGNSLQVVGELGRNYISGANQFTIEVFASSTTSVPGAGNNSAGIAQRFLGRTTVAATVTPSTWSLTTTGAQIGDVITATLRSPGGSTSEISVAKLVDQGPAQGTPSFSLNQVNAGPPLTLTPISSLNFGDVPINTSKQATVRLLSTGTLGAPITVSAITLTNPGGSPAQFTLQPLTTSLPVTLPPTTDSVGSPGSFVDFVVTALPTTIGVKNGEVTLTITTTLNQNFVLPLRVNGTGQAISTNPAGGATLNFGNVTVGETSGIQTVTVTNTGAAPLTVSLTLSGNDFVYDNGFSPSIGAISPNGAVTIPLRFRPTTTGQRTGTLSIAHNAPNTSSPIVINLVGTGIAPPAPVLGSVTINGVPIGSVIDFGSVAVGDQVCRQLVVTNTGNSTLVFNATVQGNGFSGGTGNQQVPGGASGTFQICFTPPTTGDFTGSLVIASNADNRPTVTASLTGRGVAPSISLNPTQIQFGSVAVNQTSTQAVSITNTGNAVLNVTSIIVNGQGFQAQGVPGTPFQLQPGSSQSFQVAFTPNATGAFSGTLTVTSNARNATAVTASLSGSGGDNISPTVSVSDPRSGQAFASGSRTTVRFSANDNVGVTGIDIFFSDGGSFSLVAAGLSGGTTAFDLSFSQSVNTTNARVRVTARDAAGNTGSAETGNFTVGPAPIVIGPKVKVNGKLRIEGGGSNIALSGAVLLINGADAGQLLILKSSKNRFITSSPVSSQIPRGATVQLSIRNPNGVVGPAVAFSRP